MMQQGTGGEKAVRLHFMGPFLTASFFWILSLTHAAPVSSCPLLFLPFPIPHSSFRLLCWFRSLSRCKGEAGWWGEREWAREQPSLSPRCSSHLPALPWWVVCVPALMCCSAGFSGNNDWQILAVTFLRGVGVNMHTDILSCSFTQGKELDTLERL